MKSSSLIPVLLLLLAEAVPGSAQYNSEESEGYTCWQCPVCGSIFSLTPLEAARISPYTPCPACYSAYAGSFVQVSCQEDEPAIDQEDTPVDDSLNKTPLSGSVSANRTPAAIVGFTPQKGKILMVLAPRDYQEEELNVPREYFQSRGYVVVLASKGVKTATGMNGGNASIDLDLKDIELTDFAAVVFVGGEGIYSSKLNEDADYQGLAKGAVAQGKLTAAICLGPWILADAGLLQGKNATASETDHLQSKGAVASDRAVVRDGSIITANGPDASREFAEAVVAALEESGDGNVGSSDGSEQGVSQEELSTALRVPLGMGSGLSASESTSPGASSPKYRCNKCSYIYDPAAGDPEQGIPPGTPSDKLPSTWRCPRCGAGKGEFTRA